MMRWWAVILWLLAAGSAGANVPPAGAFGYDYAAPNLLQTLTLPNGAYQTNGYDGLGRRIAKTVLTNWNGSGYQATNLTRFVYGLSAGQAGLSAGQAGLSAKQAGVWNLIAVLNSAFSLQTSFLWGLDLSGSEQGAGGVGGLLRVTCHGTQTTNAFVAHDGNGNVVALVDAANGNLVAEYAYGPFGELIALSGPLAKLNPLRFSTKYQDDETDLLYYGYRYYHPSTGRWLSRDPIGERGGLNLYACVINNPISYVETDGMQLFPPVLIEAPPVLIPRPILGPIVRPGPGIPPEWLPIPAPRPVPTPPGGGTMPPLYPPAPIIPPQPGNAAPTPDPSPNPSPQPQPNPGQNAPPQTVTQDCGEWLCRLGKNWESRAQLPSAAEGAKGLGYGYGVSVLLFSKPPATASCAPRIIVEAAFQVRKTGAKANHYTVIFPEPLTDPEADRFNRAIGRTPPPPPPPPQRPYPPGTIIAVVLAY